MSWLRRHAGIGLTATLPLAVLLMSLDVVSARVTWKAVGQIQAIDGEVVTIGERARETPVEKYSVLEDGMKLRFGKNARATLVHDKEGATYRVVGPAVIAVSQKGIAVDPSSAVSSKTSAKTPVELQAPGAALVKDRRTDARVGGESLGTTRAGLAAEPEMQSQKNGGTAEQARAKKADDDRTSAAAAAKAKRAEEDRLAAAAARAKKTEDDRINASALARSARKAEEERAATERTRKAEENRFAAEKARKAEEARAAADRLFEQQKKKAEEKSAMDGPTAKKLCEQLKQERPINIKAAAAACCQAIKLGEVVTAIGKCD